MYGCGKGRGLAGRDGGKCAEEVRSPHAGADDSLPTRISLSRNPKPNPLPLASKRVLTTC